MSGQRFFHVETEGGTMLLTLSGSVGSLADAEVMPEFDRVAGEIEAAGTRRVVVDFSGADYFGSTVLEGLRLLWTTLRSLQGRMALCGVSPTASEILETVKFDRLFPICASRSEALASIEE